ncbi:MAG: LPS sulfotransferase NodH [Planctomycetota bacterium]|jgi:LPS sulfotransferase NodH
MLLADPADKTGESLSHEAMDYLICTTPRSGSNLLCSFLMGTKEAGEPREYLCPHQIAEHGPKTSSGLSTIEGDPSHYQQYYDGIRKAYTSGGRFGSKVHLHQLLWAEERGFDLAANMPQRFVHLTRADVLGQAISFARASQTGVWSSSNVDLRQPTFDAYAITSAIRFMKQQDGEWEKLFKAAGIEPYRMAYETLVADMHGELTGLFKFLGIERDSAQIASIVESSTGVHRKQGDGISQEWREQYRDLLRERAEARASATA